MTKTSLFLLITSICLITTARAQSLSVSSDLYDSLAVDSYDFHFTGTATFTDSMEVFYSVKTNDSVPELLYIDSVDFTNPSLVPPANFSYDPQTHAFTIGLGNYNQKYLILELYSQVNGETKEHLLLNIYNLESIVENEE